MINSPFRNETAYSLGPGSPFHSGLEDIMDLNMILEKKLLSHSLEETIQFGRDFAKQLRGGQCIALNGDLGAGKTHFAKGIISELTQISPEEIHSPTFTLIEEYPFASGKLYHVDLYRIEDPQELEALPFSDFWSEDSLAVIEWIERSKWLFERCDYSVTLSKLSANQRQIEILKR